MKKLPIGIQTLKKIIDNDCIYIDKTPFVKKLTDQGSYFFLSRPRRFGKSLLLNTLKEAFLGNEALFKGLYLEHHWDWAQKYPVIHIDFGLNQKDISKPVFNEMLSTILSINAHQYDLSLKGDHPGVQFHQLIMDLHKKTGQQVVILIDEYDKPILDMIDNPEATSEMRDILRNFYTCIKSNDDKIKFCFLTGVTKFSKVSLFSGLNNLRDITLASDFSDCCGYTQSELESVFADYLDGVDMDKLKKWYNGYNFNGSPTQKVYNPFDILLFFSNHNQFSTYWFETGSPTFLIKLIQKNEYFVPKFETLTTGETLLSSFDVDRIDLTTLLFQTGYLTIEAVSTDPFNGMTQFKLNFPNFEVKFGLYNSLLVAFKGDIQAASSIKQTVQKALLQSDFEKLRVAIHSLLTGIPHHNYTNNPIAHYEGYYASLVYILFSALGLKTTPEDTTSTGRIDMTVELPDKILIIEFKVATPSPKPPSEEGIGGGLLQIKAKNYHQKYLSLSKGLYAIGICFDPISRSISDFEWEKL